MKTILVVDDTPAILSLVTTVVQMAKHTPLQAPSAEEALDLMGRTPNLDALVTDIRMPGMNGFELAQAVREARPDLPILFISGYFDSAQDVHMEWMRQPNVGFLPKPFLPAHLMHELSILLAA